MPEMARRCCLNSQTLCVSVLDPDQEIDYLTRSPQELMLGPSSTIAARGPAGPLGPDQYNQLYDAQVVLLAHSLGDVVARTFFHWVEQVSPGWVEQNVATYAPIAGLPLGAPVSLPALAYGTFAMLFLHQNLLRIDTWN